MKGFVKRTTIKEMNENLRWFDYNNLENIQGMTGDELLSSEVIIEYNKEEDICKVVFADGGHVFEPFHYEKGSKFDKEQLEDMKNM